MTNISSLTPAQLRKAAVIQEQIEALNTELAGVLNGSAVHEPQSVPKAEPDSEPVKTRKKYKLSAAGRKKKIAAIKARSAKANAAETEAKPLKKRRKMSAAAKAKIAAAAKARWARVKAGNSSP